MVRFYLLLFLMILLISGCKEDLEFPGEKDFPVVILKNPTDNNADGVTLAGSLILSQLQTQYTISYGFIIDEGSLGIDTLIVGQADSSIHFTYRFENLSINDRSIEIQAFGKDEHNIYHSNRVTIDLIGASHEIHGFKPGEGIKGDTLVIMGHRFSSERNPVIKINGNIAPILSVSSDSIVIQVPTSMGSEAGILSVTLDNHEVMATDRFKYQKPVILDLSTYIAWGNDTIIIMGENFSTDAEVIIGDAKTHFIQLSREKLIVKIEKEPFRVIEKLIVRSGGFVAYTNEPFHLLSPWKQIHSCPTHISRGSGFTLNDTGYVLSNEYFFSYNPHTNLWQHRISIQAHTDLSPTFVVDNRAFAVLAYSHWQNINLYEFLPHQNNWVTRGILPVGTTLNLNTLAADNKAFVYMGNPNDDNAPNFYQYNPENQTWIQRANLSAPPLNSSIAFGINSYGYIGTGINQFTGSVTNVFYRYDPLNNIWAEVSEFPLTIANGIGFSINNTGYAGLGNMYEIDNREIYSYDPILDEWKWVANYPGLFTIGCAVFTIGEKAYIGTGGRYPGPNWNNTAEFYEFDPRYTRENYQNQNP